MARRMGVKEGKRDNKKRKMARRMGVKAGKRDVSRRDQVGSEAHPIILYGDPIQVGETKMLPMERKNLH